MLNHKERYFRIITTKSNKTITLPTNLQNILKTLEIRKEYTATVLNNNYNAFPKWDRCSPLPINPIKEKNEFIAEGECNRTVKNINSNFVAGTKYDGDWRG